MPSSHPDLQEGTDRVDAAPRLVGWLLMNGAKVISQRFLPNGDNFTDRMVRENLAMGDVLAFADDEKQNSDGTGNYKHMCLLLGNNGRITCHTTSRFGGSYSDIHHGHITLLKLP